MIFLLKVEWVGSVIILYHIAMVDIIDGESYEPGYYGRGHGGHHHHHHHHTELIHVTSWNLALVALVGGLGIGVFLGYLFGRRRHSDKK